MTETLRAQPFRFSGSGAGYFRIWIVNLVLTVLTLGIYSAWATVRRKRYFQAHTHLAGQTFDYQADPVAILKGRLLVFALLALAGLAWEPLPWLTLALLVVGFLAAPWGVLRSLQFHARHSSYRGVHFAFLGDAGESFRIFAGWGLLTLVSLGVTLPHLLYRKIGFVLGNQAYGASRFSFQGRSASFFGIFMKAGLIMLAPLVAIIAGGVTLATVHHDGPVGMTEILATLGLGLFLIYAALPIAAGYVNARLGRLAFLGTRFGDMGFAGRHTAHALIGLYLSNLILIVLTLGLYIPWAQVRSAHFWLDNLAVVGPDWALDRFVADSRMATAAPDSVVAPPLTGELGLA